MASIIWTENALNDIDNIASYISKDSEFYAKQPSNSKAFLKLVKQFVNYLNQITERFSSKNIESFIGLMQIKFI